MSVLSRHAVMTFILTRDLALGRAFYNDVLQLPVIAEDAFAVTFALAGGATMRLTPLADHAASMHTVLGWTVPDIVQSVAALKARGVEFKVYEGFGQDALGIWTSPDGSAKVAWFCDPDGNVLSLTECGSPAGV